MRFLCIGSKPWLVVCVCAIFVATCVPSHAGILVLDSQDADSELTEISDDRIDARFRADIRNWDTRLEDSSNPAAGDTTGNVGRHLSHFDGVTFDVSLSYTVDTNTIEWLISPQSGGGQTSALQFMPDEGAFFNTFQIYTKGSRGVTILENLQYNGSPVADFSSLEASPSPGVTFRQAFLFVGNTTNLLSSDFMLTGELTYTPGVEAFTKSNPSDGVGLTIKLRPTLRQGGEVPEPTSLALLTVGSMALMRRVHSRH